MDIRVDGTSLATASQLKGMGATRGQIQLAKDGWRSVELDASSSKHQVKRARLEQGRISRLLREIPTSSSEANVVLGGPSNNPPPPGQYPRLVEIYRINPQEGLFLGSDLEVNATGEQNVVDMAQIVYQLAMRTYNEGSGDA